MGRPVKRFLLGYLAVCAAWTFITIIIYCAFTYLITAVGGLGLTILSIIVPVVLFAICFIAEIIISTSSSSDKVVPIPLLAYMIFGFTEHYVGEYEIKKTQKRMAKAKEENKKFKADSLSEYLAEKNINNEQLKSKYLYFALIPVAIVAVAFLVLFFVRFDVLNDKIAACLAAGKGKALNRHVYEYAGAEIVVYICMAVTSFVYLLMGAYQITRKTCFKCGSYMSYEEIETLDYKTSGYNENKTSKTYGESNVYINNERYTIQQEGWQQHSRHVSTTNSLYLCKCHHCGNEKKVKERYTSKSDWK